MEDFSKYLSPSEYHDETMKACREHAIGEFTTDTIPIPKPVGEQLLVKISACGVCGSDIPRTPSLRLAPTPTPAWWASAARSSPASRA